MKTFKGKALNAYPNGTARTIKAQYCKNSAANFVLETSYGATGVLRRCKNINGGGEKVDAEKTVDDYLYTAKDGEQYGIFKLSPRECGRLMGVSDVDIDKMLSVNSNSQCYKQFGNSIVVPVLCAIFSQLNIQGVKDWNDSTDEERKQWINPDGLPERRQPAHRMKKGDQDDKK